MSVYKCHAFIFLDQPPPWPSRTSLLIFSMKNTDLFKVIWTNFSLLFDSQKKNIFYQHTETLPCVSPVVLCDLWKDSSSWKVDFSASSKCLRIRALGSCQNALRETVFRAKKMIATKWSRRNDRDHIISYFCQNAAGEFNRWETRYTDTNRGGRERAGGKMRRLEWVHATRTKSRLVPVHAC